MAQFIGTENTAWRKYYLSLYVSNREMKNYSRVPLTALTKHFANISRDDLAQASLVLPSKVGVDL